MWFDFTAVQHSHHKATPENSSLGGARRLPFSFYEVQQNTWAQIDRTDAGTVQRGPEGGDVGPPVHPFIPTLHSSREIKISQNHLCLR